MSTQDPTQYRDIAKSIIHRAINDPAFADQLRANPQSTVIEAGLPEDLVSDFVANDLGIQPEVSGYLPCTGVTCIILTCEETIVIK